MLAFPASSSGDGFSSFLAGDSPEIDHPFSSDSDHHSPNVDQQGRSEATLASSF
jgi:hypothetical protein